jgi:hypothetical protein
MDFSDFGCDLDEFKCNDGLCIASSSRCNDIRECSAGEDEAGCG